MDFTPESDFQTWFMLFTITIDEGGEIQCLQDDFIRILKYYVDNKTLPPEISDFNSQFVNNMIPEIISHITIHTYAELNDDYSTYFNILESVSKLLVEGLSNDILDATKPLSYLFNYEDPFFQSIQSYQTQLPNYSQQYKKFCLEFLLNGSLEPLLKRLQKDNPNIQHFYQFFRLLSLTRVSSSYEDIQAYMIMLKKNFIAFINSIDFNSSRNMDSNELLFICSFSINATFNMPDFDDLTLSCMNFALKCIRCDFLDKQICGAKLLNKIVSMDNHDLLIKFIKELDIYNIIVSKDYHESVLPHLVTAFAFMTQIEIDPSTFNEILIKIWNKIQHSHFTTKDQWIDMLLDGVINSYDDLKIANSFLIDFLLKLDQNETTIEIIEKFIIHLPIEFLTFSTKMLEFLLSLLNDNSKGQKTLNKETEVSEIPPENDNENESKSVTVVKINEKLSEIVLTAVKRIAISANVSSIRILILNFCRKELLTAVSTNVIEILQFLIEGSSISSPGVGISQIVNDNLIDTLICALKSNKSDREPIFDLLSSCYIKVSSTPIKMNSKQVSQILEIGDEYCWKFFDILFDQRNIEFLEKDSLQYIHSYLSDNIDYSKSDEYFVMFLYNYIMAVGISQNKVVRKIQSKNQIRYTINNTNLEGIEFLSRILYESKDEQALNQLLDVFMYLITICRTNDCRGKMIEYLLSYILNPKKENETELFNNSKLFLLFNKIILKFEEGIGIEEFSIERHIPHDTANDIRITINNGLLTLSVSPYLTAYALCQKVAFYLNSTENSVFLYNDNVKLYSSYQLVALDIKEGSNLILDKQFLEPCDYHIENVPTYILCQHKIQNLCLSLLRTNCDSDSQAKKKQIWKLLKLLPSLKFENSDQLIEKIKEAVDEYELLYYLQIALKERIECSEIVLNLLKNQDVNENEKSKAHSIIKGKPISPAFSILSSSAIQVADYSNILLDIISSNIVKNKAVDSSILLLTKICNENNSIVSQFLMTIDYTNLTSDVLLKLISIFQLIEDKLALFHYLSKYLVSITNNRFCLSFFTILAVLVIEENDQNKDEISSEYEETLNLSFKILTEHKNESLLLYGSCIFIAVLFEKVPSLIPKYSNMTATVLVPYLLTETDEKTQKKITSILIKVFQSNETRKLISSLMKDHFQDIPDRWNYDPSKNVKLKSQLTGLKNLGATCFMNSILQQLYSNSEFRSEFSKYQFDTTTTTTNKYLYELQKLFVRMQMTNLPFLDTRNFCKDFIFQDKRPINVREQQDAIEFFQFIIDKFPSSLHKMYEGQIVNTIKGIDVEFESSNFESFYNICLTVKGFDNFESSFESFLKEEIFCGDNQYFADAINAKIDARKYSRINKLPNHLVIQLKRFEYNLDTFMKYKVNDRFTFPLEFNAAKYTANPDDNAEQLYKLNGIVIHDGIAEAGHYYSIILIDEDWYCFDDNDVYRCHPNFFNSYAYGQNNNNSPSAYLLFYTKKDSITKYVIENVINSVADKEEAKQQEQEQQQQKEEAKQQEQEQQQQKEEAKQQEQQQQKEEAVSPNDAEDDEEESKNENSVVYKDVKLDLYCPSLLREEIDKENHLYNQMQSNFTFTIMQFMYLIDDPEVLILYTLNVFLHSQYSSLSKDAPSFSIYKSEQSYDSNQIVSIVSSNSKSLFDVLLHCSVYDQVSVFVKFLRFHIKRYEFVNSDLDGNDDPLVNLAKNAIEALGSSISVYRSIPFISSIIYFFLDKNEGKSYGLKNNFAQSILDFLTKIIESNRANVFWTTLDLHYLFDSLVILKDGFELKSLVNLMNGSNNFLTSSNHSRSFIKLFMKCYEYDLFISHIFRLFTPQTIGKVIIETFCCCEDEASVKKVMELFLNQSEIYKTDISYNIYFAIEELSILSMNATASASSSSSTSLLVKSPDQEADQNDIINLLMRYKEIFLFDFLICDDEISRSYTEEIIYSLFPFCSQPKTSSNPFYDFLITTSCEMLMLLKKMEIDPIKAPLNESTEDDFYQFVDSFTNYFNKLIEANESNPMFIKNRLTSTSRIIRWMISNIVNSADNNEADRKESYLKKLFDLNNSLLVKVVDLNTAYDGNVYELLLTSLMILLPDFSDHFVDNEKIDIQKIILNLFPTNSFNRYTLYVSDLFLVTFIIIILCLRKDKSLLQFFNNEVFKATFIEFIRKSPQDVMDIFCKLLIDQCYSPTNKLATDISSSILSVVEPSLHQLIIGNAFSIVKVVFSLRIILKSDLFEDLFSFMIVCIEMNIEKRTNESINDVVFLIQTCIPHLMSQSSISNNLIDEYVPMFLDLYRSEQLSTPILRFILREFFSLLCQKNEILKEELYGLIYQFGPFTFETIAFFLRIIRDESDEDVFTSLLHFLLANVLKCLRNLNDECDETFKELNIMIKKDKIKFDENLNGADNEGNANDRNTWTYFVDTAKFLLTIVDWKDNTTEFFAYVLSKVTDSELLDLLKILKALIYQYIIEEGIPKAAFIVTHKKDQKQLILKALNITPESAKLWPDSCKKYYSAFFP